MPRPPKRISQFDVLLGAVVRSKRSKRDMTQAELSAATGIALSNLKRREDGVNEFTVSELSRIAETLRVPTYEFVEEALADYGGIAKLIAEEQEAARNRMSQAERTVDPEEEIPYIGKVRRPKGMAADERPRNDPKD